MQIWGWVAIVVAAAVAIAWYLSYNAARLDRLHGRVEGSASALDAQLVRRAEVSMELANSGLLDPASAMLVAEAAGASLDTSDTAQVHSEVREDNLGAPRAGAETDLSSTLRATLTPAVVAQVREHAGGAGVLDRLQQAGSRVQIARHVHNDAVHDVRRVRSKPLVSGFQLAGHTTLPTAVEFDDEMPDLLATAE